MWQLRYMVILFGLNMMLGVHANDSIESAASSKAAIFNDFPSCNEKDDNINDCLLKIFSQMIPRSKNGIPELNIPPMDPFIVNKTSYIFSHPIVQGKIAVRNIKIHGLSKVIVKSLQYKRKGEQVAVVIKSDLPELFVEGFYKAKIKFNTVNISSKGTFNVTFENIDLTVNTTSDLINRNNHRYMHLKTINFEPIVGNMKFNAEGLLPEPLLNDAIIEFLNQNWRTVYKSLIPETRAAWEPEIVKLSHAYFANVPVDVLIKED